jgi:hypothetical protein
MTLAAPFRDRICTLRVRTPAQSQAAAIAAALRTTDLHPSGLPQSAVLIVRRLQSPRTLRLGASTSLSALPVDWRDALRGVVSDRMRGAARPILGAVPAACEAVLFADTAELLACLGRDWLDGALNRRWWWRNLFPHTDLHDVAAVWCKAPTALPAALALLEHEGRAREFVRRLPTREAARLFDALAQVLPEEAALRTRQRLLHGNDAGTTAARSAQTPSGDGSRTAPIAATQAPSHVSTAGANPTVSSNVTVPSLHPSPQMGDGTCAASAGIGRHPTDKSFTPQATRSVHGIESRMTADPFAPEGASSPTVHGLGCDPASGEAAIELSQTSADFHDSVVQESEAVRSADGAPPAATAFSGHAPDIVDRDGTQTAASAASIRPATEMPARSVRGIGGERIDTAFGGLFYLLNVSLFLGLYGDFTQPRYRGLALSPWDFLALVGERWFGTGLRSDPLWELLRQLGGHESDAGIGAGFVPAAEWRMPAAWLEPFPAPACLFAQQAGARTRLRHPYGFTIRETEGAQNAPETLENWRDEYVTLRNVRLQHLPWRPPQRPLSTLNADLNRWLDAVVPYLEARLALALGEHRRTEVPSRVCAYPARLTLTPSSLDINLSLAALPLAIRYAGLDRDPGWIPAAARSIRFVFE